MGVGCAPGPEQVLSGHHAGVLGGPTLIVATGYLRAFLVLNNKSVPKSRSSCLVRLNRGIQSSSGSARVSLQGCVKEP